MKLGIMAEDNSDVEVIKTLTHKMVQSSKLGYKWWVGNGCGKLRRKCDSWADDLIRRGCSFLVLLHDLDDSNEISLRTELTKKIKGINNSIRIILIPIREIEAWLLFDSQAISSVFHGHRLPKLPKDPEKLDDPKKALETIILSTYNKRYFNTIHNVKIAANINVNNLNRARSFVSYIPFVKKMKEAMQTNVKTIKAEKRKNM